MTTYCKIDFVNREIIMSNAFSKKAMIVGSEEYDQLQMARRDYPKFKVKTKRIKTNSNKQKYVGLNYYYMEQYIALHENANENRKKYDELRLIAQCHAKNRRYAPIKKWFLETFPEVRDFDTFDINSLSSSQSSSSEISLVA